MDLSRKLLTSLAALSVGALTSPEAEAGGEALLAQARQMAARIAPNPSVAQELVAETAAQLLHRRPGVVIDFSDDCSGYLRRSLVNTRRDQMRREKARPWILESDLQGEAGLPQPSTGGAEAQERAVAQEFREALSPSDRGVLALMEEGRPERQIAVALGKTRHFVRASISRITERATQHFCIGA